MRNVLRTATACLFAILLAAPAFGGEWAPADQPDLPKQIAAAAALKAEDLGPAIRSVREGLLLRAPNPDGKTWDLVQIYFRQYGGPNHIQIIDTGSGQTKRVDPAYDVNRYNFHLCPWLVAPDGKLYISILGLKGRQKVCIYDPAANELKVDALPMPDDLLGETHPMVLGTDGMIYCVGGHPSNAASACQIDPASGKVTAYGGVGPSHSPNGCWGYSAAADGRYLYVASGKVPWYLVAFDRQERTSKVLATTENVDGYVSVGQGRFGCTARVTGPVGSPGKTVDYWLHEGKAIERAKGDTKPPWPEPADAAPMVKLPPPVEVNSAMAVPDAGGKAELWVRTAEAKAAAPAKGDPNTPLEKLGFKPYRYTIPTYGQPIHRIFELPDGRVFGSAGSYEGCFIHDPKTGATRHLGKYNLSHYATAILDGKPSGPPSGVYMSGYPTSPVYVFDPSREWTALTVIGPGKVMAENDPGSNPRMVARMTASGAHKMYAAVAGADGKVYFGGRWYRNGSCGGLGWWDPKTRQAGGMWKDFSNYQVNFMAAVDGGKTIVISAHRVDDTVLNKPKPEQGALWFFDPAEGKLTGKLEVAAGLKGPGPILAAGPGRIIGWTENPAEETGKGKTSLLYGVDVAARKVAFRKLLPVALPVTIGSNQEEQWDFRIGPDGKVWTFLPGGVLVKIDPADASVKVVGKLDKPGRLAFAGADVFLGGTNELRVVRGLAK